VAALQKEAAQRMAEAEAAHAAAQQQAAASAEQQLQVCAATTYVLHSRVLIQAA
jgi:hypothetical protein